MDSADPPLAVHGLYGGRHRQHRRRSTEQVHELGGGVPARLAPLHRSVLVRAAVCHQVAQRATHRLNGITKLDKIQTVTADRKMIEDSNLRFPPKRLPNKTTCVKTRQELEA